MAGSTGMPSTDMAFTIGNDFPAAPIIDGTTPPNAPVLFGPGGSGTMTGGPCLLDPEPGSVFPQNWMRLRFNLAPVGGQNLFEIRLHSPAETNDLVVYTQNQEWKMDAATWQAIANHLVDQPITVTVRGAVYDGTKLTSGPSIGTTGTIAIAPVSAPGAIIYWSAQNKVTALKGFTLGEEGVHPVLVPTQVDASSQCIACHSSTPDGTYVGLSWTNTFDNGDPAQIALRTTDGKMTAPSFISTAAATLLQRTQELPVYSKAHWTSGDHIMLSMLYNGSSYDITWTDLEATSSAGTGTLKRTGDNGFPGDATWSHDGNNVAYASGSTIASGYQTKDADLRVIPYANKAGGTSVAVAGASDPTYNEYFPTYSPDDQFIAFTRIPDGHDQLHADQCAGRGARRSRRRRADGDAPCANDPVACSGHASPGLTNSWPKWAPDVTTSGTRKFYWLTFSSKRIDAMTPQLFVTPVVVDGGTIKTYPALYLWNQPAGEGNHTPAWDNFAIPIS